MKNRRGPTKYQTLITNLSAGVRTETLEGREYLVVPMVMMVEGVLDGSDGPLHYPSESISTMPFAWNHKPIVVCHPSINGKPISACSKEAIDKFKVGVILNTTWDHPKLKAEAWLEPARLATVDRRVLDAVRRGEMVDVSTGVFLEADDSQGTFNGKGYNGIVSRVYPDHLAILPDQEGACSIADGCGLVRNELSYDVVRDSLYAALGQGTEPDDTFIVEVFDSYFVFEQGGNLYYQRYVKTEEDGVKLEGIKQPVTRRTQYELSDGTLIGNNGRIEDNNETVSKKGDTMEKKEVVDALIANGRWTEEDREWLMGLEECQLSKMAPVENEAGEDEEDEPKPKAKIADNEGEGNDEEDEEDESKPKPKAKVEDTPSDPPATNAREFLANAPPEIKEVLNDALQTQAEQRAKLIETIVANKHNTFTKDQLAAMRTSELRSVSALAEAAEVMTKATGAPSYVGMGNVVNVGGEKEEPLGLPVYNWKE